MRRESLLAHVVLYLSSHITLFDSVVDSELGHAYARVSEDRRGACQAEVEAIPSLWWSAEVPPKLTWTEVKEDDAAIDYS